MGSLLAAEKRKKRRGARLFFAPFGGKSMRLRHHGPMIPRIAFLTPRSQSRIDPVECRARPAESSAERQRSSPLRPADSNGTEQARALHRSAVPISRAFPRSTAWSRLSRTHAAESVGPRLGACRSLVNIGADPLDALGALSLSKRQGPALQPHLVAPFGGNPFLRTVFHNKGRQERQVRPLGPLPLRLPAILSRHSPQGDDGSSQSDGWDFASFV
jgi:hypothetical protein